MIADNLINRLTIKIKHPNNIGSADALPISQQYYETFIYPAIEKVLEKYKNHDLRIEKIEIDLNKINIDDISKSISQLLEENIKKNINNKKTSISLNDIKKDFAIKDKFQAFIYYLKYAEIPWYSDDANSFDIENIVI